MVRSIASAPGKVILFGEHAVVYGVTAIAAALSDLRIVVILVCVLQPNSCSNSSSYCRIPLVIHI
jgi:mevalonate kinase